MAKKNHRHLVPAFRVEMLKEIREAKSISASEMSKRAGFPLYYVSRIETGETAFTGHAALQFAGEFLRDFREFKNDPKDDYLNIIKDVIGELDKKLYEEFNHPGIELDELDEEVMVPWPVLTGEAPPPWRNDPRWRRAQHALTIIEENNTSAGASTKRSDQLIQQVEVELAKFGMGLQSELGPVEFMTDERIALITSRQRIDVMFQEIAQMVHRHVLLPYVDVADRVDTSLVAILQDKFTELLIDFDEARSTALYEIELENSTDGDAQMQELLEQGTAKRKKVAGSRVTPAPPPVSDARPNKRDLPVYGQARAGRDGFDLPAGAEAMSHIARPFFLDGVGTAYAVYVNGDSMEPRFRHGELLFVDPSRPPKRGDDVVVQVIFGDEICGFAKRFVSASDATTTLHQFNPETDIFHPTSDVKAVHLVVGSLAAGR